MISKRSSLVMKKALYGPRVDRTKTYANEITNCYN